MTDKFDAGKVTPHFEENPFERLAVYSRRTERGSITIDAETMVEDLIAVMKINSVTLEALIEGIAEKWDSVEVGISIPKDHQN